MKKSGILKMCLAALFAAIICVSIVALPIPLPGNGYFNLGDTFIIVAALCIGPLWGGLAAAVGAGLSDLILGYTVYAPATFIIKWLIALAVYYIAGKVIAKKFNLLFLIFGAIAGELIGVVGYFLFEIPLYGIGVALADIIGNAMQGACSIVVGTLLYSLLYKTGIVKKIFDNKNPHSNPNFKG